jgi:SAM-dependent methyltransferase
MTRSPRLASAYQRLVDASRAEYGGRYSTRLQRYFNNLTNFEYVETILDWMSPCQRVLVIGDAGGRDSNALLANGKWVVTMDVAPQLDAINLVMADAGTPFPFADRTFDGVVLAEVLEHLFHDLGALREIRRVLRHDGRLALTTPLGNDVADYHVRVYSPRTLGRLLTQAGFDIEQSIVKGGGLAAFDGTLVGAAVKHAVQWLAWQVCGRTFYRPWNAHCRRMDILAARTVPAVHRWSRHYGIFVMATPSHVPSSRQVRELNAAEFAYRT